MKLSNNKINVKNKLNSPETGAALFNNPTSSSNSDANTDEGNLIPVLLKKELHSCEAYWENTVQPLYQAEKHPFQIHSHSGLGYDHTWNKVCCGLFPMKQCNLLITLKHYGWDPRDLNSWSALGPHEWIWPFMWWLRSNRLKVVYSKGQWARSLTPSSAVSKKATTIHPPLALNMSSVVSLPSHKGVNEMWRRRQTGVGHPQVRELWGQTAGELQQSEMSDDTIESPRSNRACQGPGLDFWLQTAAGNHCLSWLVSSLGRL